MKHKNRMPETEDILVEGQECADFTIIKGEVYPDNEIPLELVDDLPDAFDEDMLYEEYRDRELFDDETGHLKKCPGDNSGTMRKMRI